MKRISVTFPVLWCKEQCAGGKSIFSSLLDLILCLARSASISLVAGKFENCAVAFCSHYLQKVLLFVMQ